MMIKRIVKLTFEKDKVDAFLKNFDERKERIANFEGCISLEALQADNVIFTFSHWESEAHLEAYRQSDFFKETWTITKQYFCDKPQAWTVQSVWKS